MSGPSSSAPLGGLPIPSGEAPAGAPAPEFDRVMESLNELAEDPSVPRNVRRGALSAKTQLERPRVALDVRISSAVSVLDELANDTNLPTHGRTAIWSIVSRLESLQ